MFSQVATILPTADADAAKRVICSWRQAGNVASLDAHSKLQDTVWIHSKLSEMSKGDLALMFEYGPKDVRKVVCQQIIHIAKE